MTRAIAYTRVSTTDQANSGVSLAAQKVKIKQYAALYDIEIVDIVVDDGKSAKSLDRPGIQKCLSVLDDGDAEALLVVKLDRLTRSVRDLNELIETYFSGNKHALISVAEALDTSTATGRLVINIMGVVSQWEREVIVERTTEAMQHKKANGEYTGGRVKYGYRVGDNGKTLEVEPLEQEIIETAKQLNAEEGLSLSAIARFLNDRDYKTRTGGQFQALQVKNMLKGAEA